MNRLKGRVDRELSDVEMTPALEDRIVKGRVKRVKKLTVALVAALVLVLAAGIAYATGVLESIFCGMKGMYINGGDEKYEAMDDLSDAGSGAEALTVAPGQTIVIKQTYYDGEQLAFGYAVEGTPAADLTFGPGHPEFAEFQEAVMGEEGAAAVYVSSLLTDEEYAQFEKTLAESDAAGFVCSQYVYLGDHVSLADGTDLPPFDNTDVEGGTYVEFETPLPDAARDRDSLTLVLDVRAQSLYYYQDATGSYVMTGPVQSQNVTVEAPRSTDRVDWYAGSYAGETYSAAARVLITPVNARATIEMKIPAEYMIPWDSMDERIEGGADILVDYELVADGNVCAGDLSETSRDDGRTLELEYELPVDGAAELCLRPVYSVSGEHPDEDIILK